MAVLRGIRLRSATPFVWVPGLRCSVFSNRRRGLPFRIGSGTTRDLAPYAHGRFSSSFSSWAGRPFFFLLSPLQGPERSSSRIFFAESYASHSIVTWSLRDRRVIVAWSGWSLRDGYAIAARFLRTFAQRETSRNETFNTTAIVWRSDLLTIRMTRDSEEAED